MVNLNKPQSEVNWVKTGHVAVCYSEAFEFVE